VINVDDVGATYLASNASSSACMRHVDSWCHYVWQYVSAGVVEIVFVKSKDNVAEPFTKNLAQEGSNCHAGVSVDDIEELMKQEK